MYIILFDTHYQAIVYQDMIQSYTDFLHTITVTDNQNNVYRIPNYKLNVYLGKDKDTTVALYNGKR